MAATESIPDKFNHLVAWLLRLIVVLAVPLLLVLLSARIAMAPQLLTLEYTRPGFAADRYGFSTQDRLNYGLYTLEYIFNDADIQYLSEQQLPGHLCYPPSNSACDLFNPNELSHMEDVKSVAQAVFRIGWGTGLLALAAGLYLWKGISIQVLRSSLIQGSLLTLGLIAAMILLAMTVWDTFFASFHAVFFEKGTWQFLYTDTLIRLYPQQFWFDAALFIGGLTTIGAVMILLMALRLRAIRPIIH